MSIRAKRQLGDNRLCIVQVSRIPPPIGGITVHTLRLHEFLTASGHDSRVFDLASQETEARSSSSVTAAGNGVLQKLKAIWSYSRDLPERAVIHVHVSVLGNFKWLAPFFFFSFRRNPKVITLHSGSFIRRFRRIAGRLSLNWILRHFDCVIAVSREQARFLINVGVPEQKIKVIPAYIHSPPDETLVPPELHQAKDQRIVITSGYLTRLYNYDVLIDAMELLHEHDELFFVFAFYNKTDRDYEACILDRLSSFPNCLVFRDLEPAVFLALLGRCDIYVRTTTADGDAVAIRESLAMGLAVIATDIVARPEGCSLFDCHQPKKLAELVCSAERTQNRNSEDNCQAILEAYHDCRKAKE